MSGQADADKATHAHHDGCGCLPSWYVDTLGAAGLPIQNNEDYAPPPEESYGALFLPDTIEKGYHVEELKDGVYWLTTGWYDCMFVCTGNGVVAVDAPCSIGERILDAIGSVTDEPVTHMIYSHWHADHVGAARVFGDKVKRYGHEKTRELLERFPDPDRMVPTETFSRDATLDVNGVKIELSYKGQNHCEGNIFVFAPRQKVLAAIDIVAPGWVAFKGCDSSDNLSGWMQAHDQILAYDFDAVVCGHVSRYGTREDVLAGKEYSQDLLAFSRQAMGEVPLQHFLRQLGSGPYRGAYRAAEENFFNAVANLATKRILERTTSDGRRWTERLNGADVMTKNNVSTMIDKMRMELSHHGYMGREGPPPGFYP